MISKVFCKMCQIEISRPCDNLTISMVTMYLGPGQEGGVGDVELVPLFLEGRAARRRLVLADLAQISVVPDEGRKWVK